MLVCKEGLNKKEKRFVQNVLENNVDLYSDFYVTKDNIRIGIRDNSDILFKYLGKGDVIAYEEDNEAGIGLVTGWSDGSARKYVKILTKDEHLASNLLKIINWSANIDLFAKLKKNNPLIKVFNRAGYSFKGDRGSEILLMRQYIYHPQKEFSKDEEGD
jgi:ATP-dependent protease HslVU (ClpYQ) peptidase subunit